MSIFEVIGDFIAHVFNEIPKRIKEFGETAKNIVNNVKKALQSDTAQTIVDLIPGEWDNKVRDEAIALLNGFASILKGIDEMDQDEQVKASAKAGIYMKMGSKMVELQDGKKYKPNRYDFYMQTVYSKTKVDDTSNA